MLAANYEGADGVRKPLTAFSLIDAQHLAGLAEAYVVGWSRVRDGMAAAVAALTRRKVAAIGDLPVKEQQAIAKVLA